MYSLALKITHTESIGRTADERIVYHSFKLTYVPRESVSLKKTDNFFRNRGDVSIQLQCGLSQKVMNKDRDVTPALA